MFSLSFFMKWFWYDIEVSLTWEVGFVCFSYLRSRVCRVERSGGDLGCLSVLVPEAAWGELKQRKNENKNKKEKKRKNENKKNLCFPCFCLAPILFAHPPNHSIACKDFFFTLHTFFSLPISYHMSLFIRFHSRLKVSNF